MWGMAVGFPCAAGLNSTETAIQIAIGCGIVVAAAIIMVVVAMWVRKRTLGASQAGPSPDQLSVEKLEEMHRSGLISREEFSALRRAALGLKPVSAPKDKPGLTEGPPRDDESKTEGPADGPSPRPGEATPPPP